MFKVEPTGNWKLGLGLSLITAIMWGSLPIALKALLQYMDVATINWFRFTIAFIIVGSVFLKRNYRKYKSLAQPKNAALMLIAVLGLLGNYASYAVGLDHITPGGAQILIQWSGISLLLGSILLFGERFNRQQWFGVGLFLIGMGLFFNLRISELQQGGERFAVGALWILFAGTVWAIYALAQKALLSTFGSQDILLIIYFSGFVAFLPMAEPSTISTLNQEGILLLAFVSLNTIIAYGAFSEAMVHWQASKVSMVNNIGPLLTLVFVAIINWLSPGYTPVEPMNLLSGCGAILVVIGSSMAVLSNRH